VLNWLEGRLPSLTKHRGERNGLTSNFSWRTLAGYEAIHMIGKGQASQCAPVEWPFWCTASILGLFAAIPLNFRLSTATFASTTNLQHPHERRRN
jgi:hypothetical protein